MLIRGLHFRNFSPLLAVWLNLSVLCWGKQDQFNSKIHYLSVQSASDTNGLKYRTSLQNVKESNKIDLEIEFINNGRPFRINSKRSKMLNKSKKKTVQLDETYTTFNDNENGAVVKRLKNSNRPRERVVVRSNEKFPPESHNLFKADKKENSSDQIKVTGQRTEGSITGMFHHQVGLDGWTIYD